LAQQSSRRLTCIVGITAVLVALGLTAGRVRAFAQGQPPQTITPNDPHFTTRVGDQMTWPAAWAFQQQKESQAGPNYSEVDVAVLDTGVDWTHPDLQGQCRTDLFANLVGDGVSDTNPFVGIHGTFMAGNICALVNNGLFVASAAGLIPGRVKVISIRVIAEGGSVVPGIVRQGLQRVLDLVARGINIKLINFSAGGSDDDPAATQVLLNQLRNRGVVVLTPAGSSMLGTYANDPRYSVVSQMQLDVTGEAPELHSNGVPFGNLAVAGGEINGIGPIHSADGGTSDGWGTGEGVSNSTSLAAGSLAALIAYGPEKDPLRALRCLELTATMFPGLAGHTDFGRIDLYAALTSQVPLPPPPGVGSVSYNGGRKVTIRGQGFGDNPGVIINGVDVSGLITGNNDRVIKLKGSVAALAIQSGTMNTVTVCGGVGVGSSVPVQVTL
jgi:thermitase